MPRKRKQFAAAARMKVYARSKFRCHLCGRYVPPGERSIDHIIPLSEGGPDTPANLMLAHVACNVRRKSTELHQSRRETQVWRDEPRRP
jgi:5-methylcytosine-specific restriction endonuclease McrA